MVTGSKELIREMNRKLVLETIINEGPLSRAAIAKMLGLTKATVSSIVQDLLDTLYVEEIGSDQTTHGRKPILLQFCRQNGHILALDLGIDTVTLMTCDLLGKNSKLHQYHQQLNENNALPFLTQIIRLNIDALPQVPFGVIGISLGIHGTVKHNEITFTPNYSLAGLPLSRELEKTFGVPVWLENEANLSALAEKTFVENHKNLIQVSIHSGVGAGIILENNLYTGIGGTAGEFGHMIVEANGLPCRCGNHGCLEQYISEPAVLNYYSSQKGMDYLPTMDDLISSYMNREPEAVNTILRFAKYLACGINNLWNLFCPECIIINSQIITYLPEVLRITAEHLPKRFVHQCNLRASALQDSAVLLGGVRTCISNFLGIEKLIFIDHHIIG